MVVATGCLGDEPRPLEEYLKDEERLRIVAGTGSGPDGGLTCTSAQGGPVLLRFTNGFQYHPVELFFVDQRCVEHPYGSVLPGGVREQPTSEGDVWRLRASGVLLREFRAPASTEAVTVELP